MIETDNICKGHGRRLRGECGDGPKKKLKWGTAPKNLEWEESPRICPPTFGEVVLRDAPVKYEVTKIVKIKDFFCFETEVFR